MGKIDKEMIYRGIIDTHDEWIEEAAQPMKRIRKNHIIWLKRAGTVAACFAAVIAVLFSVNAVFPAFAEELPIIGSVFAHFNGKTGKELPPVINQEVIDRAMKVTASGHSDPSASLAETQGAPVKITLEEASCDGMVLNLALSLLCSNEEWNETYQTAFFENRLTSDNDHPFVFSANGTVMEPAVDYTPHFQQDKSVSSRYTCIFSYFIPEELQGTDTLTIHGTIPSLAVQLYPRSEGNNPRSVTEECFSLDLDWETDFTINFESNLRTYTPEKEFGDCILKNVTIGVSMLTYDVIMPADMDHRSVALPLVNGEEPMQATDRTEKITENDDGTKTCHVRISFEDTEIHSLTFRMIRWPFEGDSPEVLGNFTLELD